MASYSLEITKSAQKEIRKLPETVRPKIIVNIQTLQLDPRPIGCQKLKGSRSGYRIHCGDYRILYTIAVARLIVQVVKVAHRKEVYR